MKERLSRFPTNSPNSSFESIILLPYICDTYNNVRVCVFVVTFSVRCFTLSGNPSSLLRHNARHSTHTYVCVSLFPLCLSEFLPVRRHFEITESFIVRPLHLLTSKYTAGTYCVLHLYKFCCSAVELYSCVKQNQNNWNIVVVRKRF